MRTEPERQDEQRNTLAEALRELRRASGLSGQRVADRCHMSQAKISRIERGRVLPSVIDVERILQALDVPEDAARDLIALARSTNVDYTAWRSYARVGLYEKQAELAAMERNARLLRYFLPAIPTGLLHTEAYARASLSPPVGSEPGKDVERIVQARLRRQEALADESRTFMFLMTEQAVRWRLADAETMSGQARHMAELASRPNIGIGIVPCSVTVPAIPLNVFVTYDDRLATIEMFSGEVVLRDPRDVRHHLDLFDFFHSRALHGADAVAFLRDASAEFMQVRE